MIFLLWLVAYQHNQRRWIRAMFRDQSRGLGMLLLREFFRRKDRRPMRSWIRCHLPTFAGLTLQAAHVKLTTDSTARFFKNCRDQPVRVDPNRAVLGQHPRQGAVTPSSLSIFTLL